MTVLVTGGAGFIGSNFVLDWLAQSDEPVINLDALTYAGNRENLASLQSDARHVFVRGDIGDRGRSAIPPGPQPNPLDRGAPVLEPLGQVLEQRRLAAAVGPTDRRAAAQRGKPLEQGRHVARMPVAVERREATRPRVPCREWIADGGPGAVGRHGLHDHARSVVPRGSSGRRAGGVRPISKTCSETKSRPTAKKSLTRTHQRTLTITPS
jgi:hypothetical protein